MDENKLGGGSFIGVIILTIISIIVAYAKISLTLSHYLTILTGIELATFVLVFLFVAYYAISGYKKPHGNLMRYMFGLFALNCLCLALNEVETIYDSMYYKLIFIGIAAVVAILSVYVGGRLNKLKENLVIIIAITLLLAFRCVYHCLTDRVVFGALQILMNFSTFIVWIDIVFAYVLRYKEHKEAGLVDN